MVVRVIVCTTCFCRVNRRVYCAGENAIYWVYHLEGSSLHLSPVDTKRLGWLIGLSPIKPAVVEPWKGYWVSCFISSNLQLLMLNLSTQYRVTKHDNVFAQRILPLMG